MSPNTCLRKHTPIFVYSEFACLLTKPNAYIKSFWLLSLHDYCILCRNKNMGVNRHKPEKKYFEFLSVTMKYIQNYEKKSQTGHGIIYAQLVRILSSNVCLTVVVVHMMFFGSGLAIDLHCNLKISLSFKII